MIPGEKRQLTDLGREQFKLIKWDSIANSRYGIVEINSSDITWYNDLNQNIGKSGCCRDGWHIEWEEPYTIEKIEENLDKLIKKCLS